MAVDDTAHTQVATPITSADAQASTSTSNSATLPAQTAPLPSPPTAVAETGKAQTNGSTQQSQLKRKMVDEAEEEEDTSQRPKLAADGPGPSRAAQMKQRRRESKYIKAGDLVIIFISRDRPFSPLTVTPDQVFTNAFGSFPHNNIIGRPFGSQIRSENNKGFLTLLRPSPELWTLSLPHRTQILYGPDMSFISMKMGLGPGGRIVEAGTGSGSFTHFLARCVGLPEGGHGEGSETMGREWKGQEGWGVSAGRGRGVQTRPPKEKSESAEGTPGPTAPFKDTAATTPAEGETGASSTSNRVQHFKSLASPTPDHDGELSPNNGKVWTFEFHASRAAMARREFVDHALTPLVSASHRNVCLNGFPSSLDGLADAVFLDLPAPWEAILFAPSVLNPKTQGVICCFSPCIEQVLRTVKALGEAGFRDVETFESLVRTHESIKSGFAGAGSAGGLYEMPLKEIGEVKEMLRDRVRKREKMSENQRRKAREKKEGGKVEGEGEGEGGDDEAEAEQEEEEKKTGEEKDKVENGVEEEKPQENGDRTSPAPISASTEAESADPASASASAPATASASTEGPAPAPLTTPTSTSTSRPAPKLSFPAPAPSTHPLPSHFGGGKEYKQQVVRSNTYSRLHASMRGHTSYLTFGRLPPRA
ncbi:GCD14-domain-containing protein [Microstroma glucosiphilum]|uniref:tRNA (adenine(58)-N(1))-methyltransferase catalytic subunit TRM61 n=1 Tax=Pseudomicrostroma glucosiphilum TaxID=1684307 RepID=A0A316U0N0_9BASI|nr:GCD14-domain-containing protein [Pseudomicrostroma glucosiphilum]PWN18043.1 GCD14-domain-containing protein [Pseudomicrostroma glucosiphilum]